MARLPQFLALLACQFLLPSSVSAVEWRTGKGFRSTEVIVAGLEHAGFSQLEPVATGLTFTNSLSQDRYTTNQIYLNGSGVAAGDVDGDGLCDLYFCGLDGPNALYRNLGNWKFENITDVAGVACSNLDATGAAFADIDGDGDLDLIVNSIGGGTECFLNDGKAHFTKVATLNLQKGGMSLALADIDGDGDLDLYVTNYRTTTLRDNPNTRLSVKEVNGKLVVLRVNDRPATEPDLVGRYSVDLNHKIIEHGEADVLFRNVGGGKFVPISFVDGAFLDEEGNPLGAPPYDWGLSVMFRDMNGDGWPDIYVCNDFRSPDRIWINLGNGHFRAIPQEALRTSSLFSMGVDFADIDRDGYDELFVADMMSRDRRRRHIQVADIMAPPLADGQMIDRPQYSRNTLFLNRGDDTYAEIAQFSGLQASEWSWTPVFLDVDLDGYEDLLITTGHERDAMNADIANYIEARKAEKKLSRLEQLNLQRMFPRLDVSNLAFRNRGDLTFEEVSRPWGFDARGVSHGMALADLDNDGDLDLAVNNLNGPAALYRNNSSAPRLGVRLKGLPPNTRGIGAKIRMFGGPVVQSQEMICGGRYLSGDDAMRVFAAGALTNDLKIEVAWRNGKRSVLEGVRANHIYEVDESGAFGMEGPKSNAGTGEVVMKTARDSQPSTLSSEPFFKDVSELISHAHADEPFDDFARQSLLPRRLSQLGPGVAWSDVNRDGHEDLIIGSGRGGQLNVFLNDGKGGFRPMREPPLTQPVTRDQTTVLGWQKSAGKTFLLAGSANYEDGLSAGSAVRQYDITGKSIDDGLPGQQSSTGPLALADLDGDGDLDLFVGGRTLPGRYPEPASSMLFRHTGDRWELDVENTKRLAKIGMVSGAVWSDLSGDSLPELVLACECGPIRIFRNQNGALIEATEEFSMGQYRGLWNGVTTGDLDGDGKMDIIASNWGWNNQYHANNPYEFKVYYGDFSGRGSVEVVEAYFDKAMEKIVPFRSLIPLGKAMPFLRERFKSHQAYAEAGIAEILGEQQKAAKELRVNTLSSMIFLNRGNRFDARPLPLEAQLAPAFGVSVADMDGDGHEDLFLSQNFFGVPPEVPRLDAGRGLWLKGDGHGGLTPIPGQRSGVKVYGEQRACAVCDYDEDGRIDLVVTQNGNASKLFHNERAKPGLRIRLVGPPANPTAVGALMRLQNAKEKSPVREVHAGSGYWSQDGAVQVLGLLEEPFEIWVRWPQGKATTSPVSPGAKEVAIDASGQLKLLR